MRKHGFTLIEVLIALAVLAIALAAAMKAASGSIDTAETFRKRTLAGWVAQNQLNEMNARGLFPDIGSQEGTAEQAGEHFTWHIETGASPNLSFRRIEIKVFANNDKPGDKQYALATLISYVANVPPNATLAAPTMTASGVVSTPVPVTPTPAPSSGGT
ncbi:type II secretion system minor pseudopilin GspI [Andreprevotia chitinilytica]|uniref:type II secretion system minor pseudopilin GspI n=1 Tax=Andreprevotia chitinilytica TaxID=396808 RepID=UPI0006921494|nr:type II secretion system minor pseudopilin GspI [Andreprevotia chitinilytica]